MKKCTPCKKPETEVRFHKNKRRSDGLCNECAECAKAHHKAHYEKNGEHIRSVNNAHYYETREQRQVTGWKYRLKKDYNLAHEDYQRMLDQQGGVCAVCGQPETSIDTQRGTLRKLSVDHCHATGRVRGLLCGKCNRGVGYFSDDTELLHKMIEYIELARNTA